MRTFKKTGTFFTPLSRDNLLVFFNQKFERLDFLTQIFVFETFYVKKQIAQNGRVFSGLTPGHKKNRLVKFGYDSWEVSRIQGK